ncbi:glycerophosphodiester phosphodiesterase [Actimicrobium antarcticum]|uniref:Glycerophosphodiester phosphodiesterase n=1 Tax=Actimicrobium antarcticum TaxID=1051899 RepID=A0ABP7TTL2_9BURK
MALNWPFPRIVAHRGGGLLAPENTLAALRCGLAHGFHAVEFDVMLAHDGVPVLMHDEQLGRTVAGSAAVPTLTSAELMVMDAGSWFGPAFVGEPVPTYRQAFEFCRQHDIWMNVEIKPAAGFEQITGSVVAALTQEWLGRDQRPPLFSSFSFDALMAAKDVAPAIPRGLLVNKIPPDWEARLQALTAVALHTDHKTLTVKQAQAIKSAGYGLFCFTVNDAVRAHDLFRWGVDGFCTDRIDMIGVLFN